MSKYTTEVRYICEAESGLSNTDGYASIEDIISASRKKIFDFDYPIFDESYRATLETKILKHYYFREIGMETVGLWKAFLNRKMNEIMPYYNKLYESELLEFNPLYSTNKTTTRTITDEGESTNNTTETNTLNRNTSSSVNNNHLDKYSDTPQGGLSGVESDNYLTNARQIEDTGSGTDTETSSTNGSSQQSNNVNNTQDYLENVVGYEGKDISEMLLKYRKTFMNIDMDIINELKNLFMLIW